MRSGDLIAILCDLGDMPLKIKGPLGETMYVQKIESTGEDNKQIEIDLAYVKPITADPVGWQSDLTGV